MFAQGRLADSQLDNPALPADQLAQLRTFVTDPASSRVVGGPDLA